MKKKPPKLEVQKYKIKVRSRPSWACMENNTDESIWETRREDRWRIVLGKKVLQSEFYSEEVAREHLKYHARRLNPKWLKAQEEVAYRRYEASLRKAQSFYNRTVSALRAQAERAKKLGF